MFAFYLVLLILVVIYGMQIAIAYGLGHHNQSDWLVPLSVNSGAESAVAGVTFDEFAEQWKALKLLKLGTELKQRQSTRVQIERYLRNCALLPFPPPSSAIKLNKAYPFTRSIGN
ncbi:hypothetical protein A9G12_07675 [Gilliamella sp. wkB112]|nr:hypothetical protein A9G12_07675 [Gilliamella apicola]